MLIEWIVSASVLTAAVLLLRLIFRRRISQQLQYLLWLPVLLRLLIPLPLFRAQLSVSGAAAELAPALFAEATAAPQPAFTSAPAPTPEAPAVTYRPAATSAPVPPAVTARPAVTAAPAAPTPVPESAQPPRLNAGQLLARLWLAGSVAALLWLLGVNLRFERRLRLSRKLLRETAPRVYLSPAVASPCLFGLLRPAIYLTPACAEGPAERQQQVLLHEETHRKQGDHIWGCLRCLCLAVWWWNPLVWLAAVCSRRDGELSCDEKVMKLLGEEARLDYGRTLVALLPGKAPRPLLSAATLSGGARAMKERLERIVKRPKAWALAAVLALLLVLAAVGCAFAGRPAETPEPVPSPSAAPGETPTPSPEPSAPPTAAPTPDGGTEGETELLLWRTKRENVESIHYTLDSWGQQVLLRKGEEGFEEALDILFSLRGERCEAPRALVSRSFDLDPRVQLAWDGERLYGSTNNGYRWLRLEGEGRPDQELSAIMERCGRTGDGVGGLAPTHESMIRDGSLTARMACQVYDWATLVSAKEGMYEAYKETGSKAVDERGEACIILDNRTEGNVYYGMPSLEMLVDGEWHTRYFVTMATFDIYGSQGPGERMVNIPLWHLAGEIEPGQYRICVTYFLEHDSGPDHVVYAEFEIAENAPEAPEVVWPWQTEALEAYAGAEEAWRWFTVDSLWELHSVDWDTTDGEGRHLITDERFADWETLENYLLQFFSRELTERLLADGPYKEVDGRVYGAPCSAGTDQRIGRRTELRAFREWNGNIYVAASYELLSEEDFITPVAVFTCTYLYRYELADHRVFMNFSLPYAGGVPADAVLSPLPTPEPAPEPNPQPSPEPVPEPVSARSMTETYITITPLEGRENFLLCSPLPAGWTVRPLIREEREALQPHYLLNDAPNGLYFLDEEGRCVGALGCFAYEETAGAEGDPRAVYGGIALDSGYRFDVREAYAVVYAAEEGENALTKVYYSAATRQGLGETAEEKWNDGLLCRSGELLVYAALELEAGVLTEADLRAMAEGLRLIALPLTSEEEGTAPAPEPQSERYEPVTPSMGTDWLTLPEGARWLTAEELAEWEAWFAADWMRPQFLYSAYARPEDVDLRELFYNGVDEREESLEDYRMNQVNLVTQEDVYHNLRRLGTWNPWMDADKLPRSQMDAVLRKYLGLGLEETARVNLIPDAGRHTSYSFPYIPETDSFYHAHGDTNAFFLQGFLYGYARGEETCLFYNGISPCYGEQFRLGYTYLSGVYRVQLRRAGETVHFLSNLLALAGEAGSKYETPLPAPSAAADYSGDYGRDITVLTPEATVFGSYEEARSDTEAGGFRWMENPGEENATVHLEPLEIAYERACPGYGTLIYGSAAAGTPHGNPQQLCFITEAGVRYELPIPLSGLSEVRLDEAFRFSGQSEKAQLAAGLIQWQIRCEDETNPALGLLPRQGGELTYTLWLPTMELFIYFCPDE